MNGEHIEPAEAPAAFGPRQPFVDWNQTTVAYPDDRCVHELFEAQAIRTPHRAAVAHDGHTLSYRELNEQANQLAHHLRGLGVGAGSLVGLCLDRSLEMIVALLGILKAGGAYVPLNPDNPAARLAEQLSPADVLVTQCGLLSRMPKFSGRMLCIDRDRPAWTNELDTNPWKLATAENIVYVIYTSGSTGVPKGVAVRHRNLVNYAWFMAARLGLDRFRDGLQFATLTTLSADLGNTCIFPSLISGGCLHVLGHDVATDANRLAGYMAQHPIDVLKIVPSHLSALVCSAQGGLVLPREYLIVGGEALTVELLETLQSLNAGCRILNHYGPTETTVGSLTMDVTDYDAAPAGRASIPIGRPIANTQVYILDAHLAPVPVGTIGELYIAGAGVTAGYLNQPELTSDRFMADPFAGQQNTTMYRTGDLARYLTDGHVEFRGRADDQVKIRGFRVEPGDIAAAIHKHAAVQQAVVLAQKDEHGDRRLIAYVVPIRSAGVSADELRVHLKSHLPEYMVPQAFVILATLPLTANGKVDRSALPAPEAVRSTEYVAPRTPVEAALADIWCELLTLDRVGIHDDFFDLGGHSILAIKLISRIASTLHARLPLQVLLKAPTVAQLAEKLTALSSGTPRRIAETATERRLLAIWERLLGAGTPIGVQDNFVTLHGTPELFEQVLAEIRTTFGVFAEGLPTDDPTIEALARIIDNSLESGSSLVVPLQPRGSQRPLFLIHAGGGYVFFYRALASRLGPDRPVYGVRAETSADGLGRPFDRSKDVEALAARYIREIKTIQPAGPYSLGGACFGGVVAFEMARQLRSRGEAVAGPVLLFDAFVSNNPHGHRAGVSPPWFTTTRAPLQRRISAHLRRASRLGPAKAFAYLLRTVFCNLPSEAVIAARALRHMWPPVSTHIVDEPASIEEQQLRAMRTCLKTAGGLLSQYEPGVYEGGIALFKAGNGKDPEPLWAGLARGACVVHTVPGRHLEMMEEPAVAVTAALVRATLVSGETSDTRETATPGTVPSPHRGWSPRAHAVEPDLKGAVG